MAKADLSNFRELCEKVRGKIHPSLRWEWDERFHVARMVFTAGQSKDVYALMSKEFAENWISDSLPEAPPLIRDLAEQIFGIRHGQLLFTMNSHSMVVLFAAWWPWETGNNISLRIGMRSIEGSECTEDELEKEIRDWFQV